MIYVIQTSGKGQSKADSAKLHIFDTLPQAEYHINSNEQLYIDGHEYWTKFDIVDPGETIELYPA